MLFFEKTLDKFRIMVYNRITVKDRDSRLNKMKKRLVQMTVFIVAENENYRNEITGVFSSRERAIKHIAKGFSNDETTINDIRDYLNNHYDKVRFGNIIVTITTEEIQ